MKKILTRVNFKIIFVFGLLLLFGIGLKKTYDYDDFGPTVIVDTNGFKEQKNKELLKGDIVMEEFRAKNNNLGIVSILFSTNNKVNDDYLQFSIREKGKKEWYYTNKYKVDQFQDYEYFPFGFPEVRNSKGKIYQIQIESLDGKENNSVEIIRDGKPFLSKYSFSLTYLRQNKKVFPVFIVGKLKSYFGHISSMEYLLVFGIPILLLCLCKYISVSNLIDKYLSIKKMSFLKISQFLKKIKENKLIVKIFFVFSLIGLFIINLIVNWQIRLKALAFGDDLMTWNLFDINRNNFFGYILNTYANKFRPVFNVVFFILFSVFKDKTYMFGIFNILFSFLIAIILFLMFRKISKSISLSFCFSAIFILSRFSYYNITQALGVMESMALLFAVLLIYLLWCYLNTEKIKYFWISLVMFTMLIFTHERFITILGLYFVLFLMLGLKRKNILLFVYSTLPVILNFILKIFVLRIRPLDGTGGTDILQTFNIAGFFQNFLSGWFYIFGVNAGPASLSGIPSQAVPKNINILILIGFICILTILILFVLSVLKSKRNVAEKYLKNFVLFFVFIFFTILAASVTIRVEMRWVYAPFVGLLFLLVYMVGVVIKQKIMGKICIILTIVWLSMIVPTEMFYRSYFKNIYYWGIQTFGNALYEATLKKYGEDFWNYDTYIACVEGYSQTLVACDNYVDLNLYFNQYDKERTQTRVSFIDDLSQFPADDKSVILFFDKQNRKFIKMKN